MPETLFALGPEPAAASPERLSFTVFGLALPSGSKQSFVPLDKQGNPFRRENGGVVVSTVDSNPKAKGWKNIVAKAASKAYDGQPWDCPLGASFTFYRPRPKCHFNSKGALNKTGLATPFPATVPDGLKLCRSIEDAMKGIVYIDDCRIVEEHWFKHWGDPARVEIQIWTL